MFPGMIRSVGLSRTSATGWLDGADTAQMEVRAERILVLAAVVIRGTFVLQVLVAMLPEGSHAARPGLFYCLSVVMVVESVLVVGYMLRRGRYVSWAAVVDIGLVVSLVIVQPFSVRLEDMVGTWVGWAYAAAFAAVIPAAIGVRQWRIVLGGAGVMAAGYLVGTLSHPISENFRVTAITNALSILGMSVAGHLGGGFVRSMGQEADRYRERERTLLHNSAPVLHLLSQEITDPRLRESAMGAAARGAQQIRAVLSDRVPVPIRSPHGQQYLRGVVDGVCQEFTDLPLTANLELLGSVVVAPEVTGALAEGIRTLLWNIRRHAHATAVTVHGDADDLGGWTVTVSDNGAGFDPATTRNGWGLQVQAGSALSRVGVLVRVDSAPGEGTRVQLRPEQGQP